MSTENINIAPYIEAQETIADNEFTTSLRLPPEYVGFLGHFPGSPILPGIYQCLIAVELIGRFLDKTLEVRGLNHAKYLVPIQPDQLFSLNCKVIQEESGYSASVRFMNETGSGITKFKLSLQEH